jgi:ferredoxin
MRISVDRERCEGHGQCSVVDLDLFPLDEAGFSAVGEHRPVPPGEEDQAEIGVSICPLAALRIEQD